MSKWFKDIETQKWFRIDVDNNKFYIDGILKGIGQ